MFSCFSLYRLKYIHCPPKVYIMIPAPGAVLTYGNCLPIALFPAESGSSLRRGQLTPCRPQLLYKRSLFVLFWKNRQTKPFFSRRFSFHPVAQPLKPWSARLYSRRCLLLLSNTSRQEPKGLVPLESDPSHGASFWSPCELNCFTDDPSCYSFVKVNKQSLSSSRGRVTLLGQIGSAEPPIATDLYEQWSRGQWPFLEYGGNQ